MPQTGGVTSTVVITGARGFIGSHLVRHFSSRNARVIAMCRSGPPPHSPANVSYRPYSLPDRFNAADLEGGDVLIHCAVTPYTARQRNSDEMNIRGTELLLEASRRLGFRAFVFLSSLSAHERATSHYGRHKLQLERIFDLQHDLVLRPGLVLGNGGLVRSIARAIRHLRVVPLIGGGRQRLYTIGVDDLCEGIDTLLRAGVAGRYVMATPNPMTMREFYERLALQVGVRCVFVPVPFRPLYAVMRAFEMARIDLPITTENLLGLTGLDDVDVGAGPRAPGICLRPFEDTMRSLTLS